MAKMTVEQITAALEQHVGDMFNDEGFKRWLKTLSLFPSYSLNNTLLINMQRPTATKVCGYKSWLELGRQVKRGESAIKIYAPIFKRKEVEEKDRHGNPIIDNDGNPKKKLIEWTTYTLASVFDIEQTEGEDLPDNPAHELDDEVDGGYDLYYALKELSPVPVIFKRLDGDTKGYFDKKRKEICLNEGMSEAQTIKTLVHEMAHATLHSQDSFATESVREVQAEAVAYTVCQHFDIDTSEYSFGYIAGWSQNKELDELKASLDVIRMTSAELIKNLESKLCSTVGISA